MRDLWEEIMATIKANKMRTFFTGFAVAWGIFMLIILLAAGNGLSNGITSNFALDTKNSVYIWSGKTSMPYAGYQKGRRIKIEDKDYELADNQVPNVQEVSLQYVVGSDYSFSNGNKTGNYRLVGVTPNYNKVEGIEVIPGKGRFINNIDIREKRKVIVIHEKIAEVLFGSENPIGKYVNVNKIVYQIVGVSHFLNPDDNREGYIPLTTAKEIYNYSTNGYSNVTLLTHGLETQKANTEYDTLIQKSWAKLHSFNPQDHSAIGMWNNSENYVQNVMIFKGISLFIWIIGIGTLIAGIVGVSNIMLITVRERTKEFGIRKALGATPRSILKLVLVESVVITSFFGYVGMVLGIGLTEGINAAMTQQAPQAGEPVLFKNPTVDLKIVFAAMLILILAGLLAGYFPAKKAVKVKPIEALRDE